MKVPLATSKTENMLSSASRLGRLATGSAVSSRTASGPVTATFAPSSADLTAGFRARCASISSLSATASSVLPLWKRTPCRNVSVHADSPCLLSEASSHGSTVPRSVGRMSSSP